MMSVKKKKKKREKKYARKPSGYCSLVAITTLGRRYLPVINIRVTSPELLDAQPACVFEILVFLDQTGPVLFVGDDVVVVTPSRLVLSVKPGVMYPVDIDSRQPGS